MNQNQMNPIQTTFSDILPSPINKQVLCTLMQTARSQPFRWAARNFLLHKITTPISFLQSQLQMSKMPQSSKILTRYSQNLQIKGTSLHSTSLIIKPLIHSKHISKAKIADGNLWNQQITESTQQNDPYRHSKTTSSVDWYPQTVNGHSNCGTN